MKVVRSTLRWAVLHSPVFLPMVALALWRHSLGLALGFLTSLRIIGRRLASVAGGRFFVLHSDAPAKSIKSGKAVVLSLLAPKQPAFVPGGKKLGCQAAQPCHRDCSFCSRNSRRTAKFRLVVGGVYG